MKKMYKKINTKHIVMLIIVTIIMFNAFGCISGCIPSADIKLQVASRSFSDYGGEKTQALVRITNINVNKLSSNNGYFLSYHLKNSAGKMLQYDNIRTNLSKIKKGETKDILMEVKSPENKGKYIIEVDIVKEGQYWLNEKGNSTDEGKLYIKNDALAQQSN